jgi:hypothetical protein
VRKLIKNAKYEYKDGFAVIYLKSKISGNFVPVFECHTACIPLIISSNSLTAEGVVLVPASKSGRGAA